MQMMYCVTWLYFFSSVQRDDIGAHINVGRTYNHLKMYKEAEDAYLQVTCEKKIFPSKMFSLFCLLILSERYFDIGQVVASQS